MAETPAQTKKIEEKQMNSKKKARGVFKKTIKDKYKNTTFSMQDDPEFGPEPDYVEYSDKERADFKDKIIAEEAKPSEDRQRSIDKRNIKRNTKNRVDRAKQLVKEKAAANRKGK